MGKWTDEIRNGINKFLNSDELGDRVEKICDEELTSALEMARPEIQAMCQDIVKQVIESIKNKDVSIDKSKLKSIYSKLLEDTFDSYESDIIDILGEKLKNEFKFVSIIPTKN